MFCTLQMHNSVSHYTFPAERYIKQFSSQEKSRLSALNFIFAGKPEKNCVILTEWLFFQWSYLKIINFLTGDVYFITMQNPATHLHSGHDLFIAYNTKSLV